MIENKEIPATLEVPKPESVPNLLGLKRHWRLPFERFEAAGHMRQELIIRHRIVNVAMIIFATGAAFAGVIGAVTRLLIALGIGK